MISLSLSCTHTHTHTHTNTQRYNFLQPHDNFSLSYSVNTNHNLGTFAKKMSPTSLTMPGSMLSSTSKEMVLPSSCVAIKPKYVHKKKSMYQTQMADLICTKELKKITHQKQGW